MVRIEGFVWDNEDDPSGNVVHIAQHGVSPEEVEEALLGGPLVLRGRDGRYLGYGRTADGRSLFIAFVVKAGGMVRTLTARAMTDRERSLHRRKRGKR